MFRRLALVAALAVVAVGCQQESPAGSPLDAFWSAAAQTDDQRSEVLGRTRALDSCALLPRAKLAELGSVIRVGTKDLNRCEAQLDVESHTKGKRVSWGVDAPLKEAPYESLAPGKGTVERIGAATVALLSDQEMDPSAAAVRDVQRTCSAQVRFPAGAGVTLAVDTPAGTEPCAFAKSVAQVIVGEWNREPRQGDSEDTVTTALTGADPCAVLPRLGPAARATGRELARCAVTLRDQEITLEYEYSGAEYMQSGLLAFTVGARPVYAVEANGYTFLDAAVGTGFEPAAESASGPLLPVIHVAGADRAALEEVMRQALSLFP
ncbi:hypothetical protein AB0H76_03905 [Nocardia sp. NPDC050712]|uniref:hypothetical protein n=1 Tax=Nocardia sp. NPDC050712 TaxID=3155518 RepID=UPI00340D4BF7